MNPPWPSLVSTRSVACVRAFVCLKVARAAPVRMSWKVIEPVEVEGDEQQTTVSCTGWVCIFQKPGRSRGNLRSRRVVCCCLDDLKPNSHNGTLRRSERAHPIFWRETVSADSSKLTRVRRRSAADLVQDLRLAPSLQPHPRPSRDLPSFIALGRLSVTWGRNSGGMGAGHGIVTAKSEGSPWLLDVVR